jgi:hypothetical protein
VSEDSYTYREQVQVGGVSYVHIDVKMRGVKIAVYTENKTGRLEIATDIEIKFMWVKIAVNTEDKFRWADIHSCSH